MNLDIYSYFVKVADSKSISKVANQYHISQSALSQMMQKMEDHVGYKILERSNKGVELTKYGEIVYDYANVILSNYDKMLKDLECMENEQCHAVINSTWALAHYSLPCTLVKIKQEFPHFKYDIISNRSEDVVSNIINGVANIGIIYGIVTSDELQVMPFGKEPIVLVARHDYKIPDTITSIELMNYNIINFKHGCYNVDVKSMIEKYISTKKVKEFNFEPLLDLDSISAVKSSVDKGFGVSFLPFSSVKNNIKDGKFKIVNLENFDLVLDICLVSLTPDKRTTPINNLIEVFLKYGPKSFC